MDVTLASPRLDEETLDEAERVLREEFFLGGDTVDDFEADLRSYFNVEHAVTLDSGTRALHFALEGLGIGEGDVVVTTPATFIATANVIVQAGAEPRFVDIDMDTYGPALSELERVVSEEPVDAVMPIHLYGYPIDLEELRGVVGDTPIVSDACQAHGAKRDGYKIGEKSEATALSFYPSKNMTVGGDGGVLLTDDDTIARIARSLRDVGRSESGYDHERIGYTARLNTVNAAIGRKQLHSLDEWNDRRREVAAEYDRRFAELPIDLPPQETEDVHPAWYFYTIRTEDPDGLRDHLAENGVEGGAQYRTPVHLQPPYRKQGYTEGDFPNAEKWADTLVTLPCHQYLTEEEVDQVVTAVESHFH